jgi:tetratricopeptide (TPR) repeat protein
MITHSSTTPARRRRPERGIQGPDGYFRAGIRLLNIDPRSALPVLAQAHELNPHEPRYTSYMGLAMVLARVRGKEGLALCEQAARDGYYDADTFLNLGRAYLESGQRRKARETFLHGLKLDPRHESLRREIGAMGNRRPPVFSSLPRNHWLNRRTGMLLRRMAA